MLEDGDYYVDWEEDIKNQYLEEAKDCMENNQLDELDSMTELYTTRIAFSEQIKSGMILALIDMGIEESKKCPSPKASQLKFWLYLMMEKRGHEALFIDDKYREFIAEILEEFATNPQINFLNKTITVIGNYSSQDNQLPLVTSIDNFFKGEVFVDFEREIIKTIRFNNDRPLNALVSNACEPSMQRRHIISVRWIKDAIKQTFENRDCLSVLELIRAERWNLSRRLNIKQWPQYPSRASLNRQDFEDCLALYHAEQSIILKQADKLSLSPLEQIALHCQGFDAYTPDPFDEESLQSKQILVARGIAQLYRDMVHNQNNQFLGAKQDNDRLGKFMYFLHPHVENWRYKRQFPLKLPLDHEKDKVLRDFFFGQNIPAKEKKMLVVDSREMLLNLYFNAHYDYQDLSEPRLSNHTKFFLHTYDKAVVEPQAKKMKLVKE